MTEEQRKAHLRLCSTLPKRNHYAPVPAERGGSISNNPNRKKGRPVIVNGERYKTMREAGKALGMSRQCVAYLVKTGRARYA